MLHSGWPPSQATAAVEPSASMFVPLREAAGRQWQPLSPSLSLLIRWQPDVYRDEDGSQAEGEEDDGSEDGEEAASGPVSFWGVASALTATVKARTAEVLTAVQTTDWKAELAAFKEVGAGLAVP